MEIIKYKKIKNNKYEITLDNGSVLQLFDDTIMKYALLLNKNVDNTLLKELTNYNDGLEAYYLTIKYISKKMRSELEIRKYLRGKDFSNKDIDNTIDKLTKEGLINKSRFIESYINDQINLTNNGPEKIKYSLIKLGFKEEEIMIDYDFSLKIENLINKKVKLKSKLNAYTLKNNIAIYLINLGYPKEMFNELLENISVNDSELIKKDYDLLLKKYSRKYEKRKLNLFIKDKLYKKGYNIEEINEVINDDVY